MKRKWEYKVLGIESIIEAKYASKLENDLNTYGEAGWELVGILDQIDSGFGSQPKVESNLILFKREKE